MTTESGTPRDDLRFLMPLLFPLILVGMLLSLEFLPEWRANHFYVEGRCVLLDKRVHEDGGTYRPEFLIRYTVAGREHQVWATNASRSTSALRWPKERVLARFTVGEEYPCWYDPADPSRVVLVRGYSWLSYVCLVVFGVLLFFMGKDVLRRQRDARRAADEASGAESGPDRTRICTLPRRQDRVASVHVTPAAAAGEPGVRRRSVPLTAIQTGIPSESPPDAHRRFLGRLAAPLSITVPLGLCAGVFVWGTWSGMTVGGLMGLVVGLAVGTVDWLRDRR